MALNHFLINVSSAVHGCRQKDSPNSWLKYHNNLQVIQTTPSVINKSITKMFLTSNHWYQNYKFSIHSIVFFSEKWSHLNRESNMHRSNTVYKWKQSKTILNQYFGVRGQQELDFFSGGSVINTLMMFFLTNAASHFTRPFTLWLVILVIHLSLAK